MSQPPPFFDKEAEVEPEGPRLRLTPTLSREMIRLGYFLAKKL